MSVMLLNKVDEKYLKKCVIGNGLAYGVIIGQVSASRKQEEEEEEASLPTLFSHIYSSTNSIIEKIFPKTLFTKFKSTPIAVNRTEFISSKINSTQLFRKFH